MSRPLLAATAALAAAAAPATAAESYTIDPAHSIPVFEFKHLGLTTQTGRFDRVYGRVVLDRRAQVGSVEVTIETASLNMGFGTETSGSPGYALFQVERFPTMRFKSDRLVFEGRNVVAAEGQFTLLGVTRPMRLAVHRFQCSANPMNGRFMCAANVTGVLLRSDFGMTRYVPSISDEIKISVPVEAYRD